MFRLCEFNSNDNKFYNYDNNVVVFPGGFQYGNVDFSNRLSYGGGGGGGGGSQFGYAGGRGGHGGGLVLLFVDKLTLNGRIEAKGKTSVIQLSQICIHKKGKRSRKERLFEILSNYTIHEYIFVVLLDLLQVLLAVEDFRDASDFELLWTHT